MPVTVGDLLMIEMDRIQETVAHIVREFSPHKVILFGSGASGRPTADSDVDLLVILPFAGHHTRKAVEILERVDPPFRIDLLVRTSDQVRQRLEWNDFVLREERLPSRCAYTNPCHAHPAYLLAGYAFNSSPAVMVSAPLL
jgi:predicted nucleotidyltransferase